ncbi:MAG: hypothetical protein BM564_13325 [Bacteroidetes bacterium MedPE-SWsnd-G2]|nr:MAG: hypothetical protein BM564_13325 [Bacteroidetes bacterium MedPE-SWsnd-G2]
MIYNEVTKKYLINFIEKIEEKLETERGIKLKSLEKFKNYLQDNSNRLELIGKLSIDFNLVYHRKDGTKISNTESLLIESSGFQIINHYSENFFGEGYYNHDDRFYNEKEPNDSFEDCLENSLDNINRITVSEKALIQVDASRFGLKTKRVKAIV